MYIRDVDDAAFLLLLCVSSLRGATRVLLTTKNTVSFLTQETKAPKKETRHGHFRPILGPDFWKLSFFFGDREK